MNSRSRPWYECLFALRSDVQHLQQYCWRELWKEFLASQTPHNGKEVAVGTVLWWLISLENFSAAQINQSEWLKIIPQLWNLVICFLYFNKFFLWGANILCGSCHTEEGFFVQVKTQLRYDVFVLYGDMFRPWQWAIFRSQDL